MCIQASDYSSIKGTTHTASYLLTTSGASDASVRSGLL